MSLNVQLALYVKDQKKKKTLPLYACICIYTIRFSLVRFVMVCSSTKLKLNYLKKKFEISNRTGPIVGENQT